MRHRVHKRKANVLGYPHHVIYCPNFVVVGDVKCCLTKLCWRDIFLPQRPTSLLWLINH